MSHETTDASDQESLNRDEAASGGAADQSNQTDTPQIVSLKDQLAALKKEQAAFDAKLVAKAIADLEKLIDDVQTAKNGYSQADYDALVVRQSALEGEMETLEKALKAALGDGIDAVKAVQVAKLEEIDTAAAKVETAADKASNMGVKAAKKAAKMAEAEAALDRWSKLADSIGKRQKAASNLIEEIKKLRNGPHRGEAYWKLALGDRDRLGAQGFLHLLLSDPPELVKPADLDAKITAAWDVYNAARVEDAAAKSDYAGAQADHKAAKADYDAKIKSIIKTIIDALAALEAPPAA